MANLIEMEARRQQKHQEIVALLEANGLGGEAAYEEAETAIEDWEEGPEMELSPPEPRTPLQSLLREYHDICEEILNHRDMLMERRMRRNRGE